MPVLDPLTLQSTLPHVFFGGDSALGRRTSSGRWRTGHDAAISIDKLLHGEDVKKRPPPHVNLMSQKMGIHEWSYDNAVAPEARFKVPLKELTIALKDIRQEVELGFDPQLAFQEAQRCLNCDVQTCSRRACASSATRAWTSADGLHHVHPRRPRERAARAPHGAGDQLTQDLYVGAGLKTGRIMAKDEDVCLHCGCAPSAARPVPGTCRNSCST
jgi:hypothetical protein